MARLQEREIPQEDTHNDLCDCGCFCDDESEDYTDTKIINLDDINDPAAIITTVSADKQKYHDIDQFLEMRVGYAVRDWVIYNNENYNMTIEELREMVSEGVKYALDSLEEHIKESYVEA